MSQKPEQSAPTPSAPPQEPKASEAATVPMATQGVTDEPAHEPSDPASMEWMDQQQRRRRFWLLVGLFGVALVWTAGIPLYLWSVAWDQQLRIVLQAPSAAIPETQWPIKVQVFGSQSDINITWSARKTGPPVGAFYHLQRAAMADPTKRHWLRVPSSYGRKRLWLHFKERSGWWRRSRRFPVPLQRIAASRLILATLSKPMYQPGDTVHLRLQARDKDTGLAAGDLKGTIRLLSPKTKGDAPKSESYPIQLSPHGVGQARFVLPNDAALGTYRLEIQFGARVVKGSFVVSRYTLPAFRVSIASSWKRSGEPLKLTLQARYGYGAPVKAARVVLQLEGVGVKRRLKGKTNSQGQARFTWRSRKPPAQLVATAQVTDAAGRVESTQRILRSPNKPNAKGTKRKHRFALLGVEGGVVVPGIKSSLSFSTDRSGHHQGTLACQGRSHELRCDKGLCRVSLQLSRKPPPLSCQVQLGKGSARSIPLLQWLYTFSRGKPQHPAVVPTDIPKPSNESQQSKALLLYWHSLFSWQGRIRLAQPIVRAGGKLKGRVLWANTTSPAASYKPSPGLLLIHRSHHGPDDSTDKIMDRVSLKSGADGAFVALLPASLQGVMWLRAEGRLAHRIVPARIVVQPRFTATIKATADKPVYRPGEQARLRLQALRHDGKGTAATLGVEAVDARILALRGAQDSFLQWALPFLSALQPRSDVGIQGLAPHRAALHEWLLGDKSIADTDAATYMAATLAASAKQPHELLQQPPSDSMLFNRHKWHRLQARSATLAGFDRVALIELWWGIPLFITLLTLLLWGVVAVVRWWRRRREATQWDLQRERIEAEALAPEELAQYAKAAEAITFTTPSQSTNRVFALVLCSSLLLHSVLYYVAMELGPLEKTPTIQDLEPRFARLIISPAGLQLHHRSRPKPMAQPQPRPKIRRLRPAKTATRKTRLGLKRYLSQKGMLALIGTPASSRQLQQLMSRSALRPASAGSPPNNPGLAATWSTGQVTRHKRQLDRSSWGIRGRARVRKRAARSRRSPMRKTMLSLLGAGSRRGSILSAKGFGGDDASALGMKLKRAPLAKGMALKKQRRLKPPRQDFPEILFWKPEWQLPSSGKGELRFRVADAITTWHLRLFGLTAQGFPLRYTKKIRVFQPFFLEFQPPKQMIEGDAITTSLIITNHSRKALNVSVATSADRPGRLTVQADRRQVTIGPRGIGILKLRLQAQKPGRTKLTIRAKAGKEQDSLSRAIEVLPQGEPIRATWSGMLPQKHQQTIALPTKARAETATLQVRLLRPAGVMLQSASALLKRPYGCFEQTASSTAPNVLVYQLLQAQGDANTSQLTKARKHTKQGYKRMLAYEHRATGGFSLYGKGRPSLHLTAYGYRVLREMRQVFPVPSSVLRRTRRWLLKQQRPDGAFAQKAWFPRSELRQTILAMKALKGSENRASLQRARAWLMGQLPTVTDPYVMATALPVVPASARVALFQRLIAAMNKEAAHASSTKHRRWTIFGSWGTIRRHTIKALALQALPQMELPQAHQHIPQTWLKELIKARSHGGGWATTALTLAALRALKANHRPQRLPFQPVALHLTTTGMPKAYALVRPGSLDLAASLRKALASGQRQLKIALRTNQNNPKLLYQIDLAYHPKRPASPKRGALRLAVTPSRRDLRVGQSLRYQVVVENQKDRRVVAPMVILGVPPGLVPEPLAAQPSSLRRVVQRQERRGGRLFLYLRGMPAKAKRRFAVGFVGRFPARAQSGLHQAFPYYNPDHRTTLRSFRVTVR